MTANPQDGRRALICEDEPLTSAALAALCDQLGYDVVGRCQDGSQSVECALLNRPDLILMDIKMPGMDGIEATRSIFKQMMVKEKNQRYPSCRELIADLQRYLEGTGSSREEVFGVTAGTSAAVRPQAAATVSTDPTVRVSVRSPRRTHRTRPARNRVSGKSVSG